ncbi:MAG TPA: hypothetical protein VGW75_04605 [Solirubrobacteraceae bacterium]|jgi:hypothetical protein|nr:hypothetical protein [Solirubrobacteraceae bacterium]
MAQTRKRRRSKHRGNAAGMVEARGRTGRRPEDGEKRPARGPDAAARRRNRMETPPTWRSAFNRAAVATVVFGLLVVVAFRRQASEAILLAAFMLVLYVPLTYYTDLWLHRRWVRKHKAGAT